MNPDYLIYALYCPVRNRPVYVGKSSAGMHRPFDHIKERSHSHKVNEWIHSLKKDGLSPILVILDYATNEDLLNEKETFWIHKFISEGNFLLNQQKIKAIIFDILPYCDIPNKAGIEDVAIFIRAKRKQTKLTQQDLSKKAGVGLRFIRDIEQNTKGNFNTKSILKVLSLFGATLGVISTQSE